MRGPCDGGPIEPGAIDLRDEALEPAERTESNPGVCATLLAAGVFTGPDAMLIRALASIACASMLATDDLLGGLVGMRVSL